MGTLTLTLTLTPTLTLTRTLTLTLTHPLTLPTGVQSARQRWHGCSGNTPG